MEISATKQFPGYEVDTRNIKVFLDGVELKRDVVAASEEKGMAIVFKRDSRGKLIIIDDLVQMDVLTGVVEIKRGE